MKAYIITEGDYSDYHIIGVYSTKELAENANTLFDGCIEEFELDKTYDIPVGYKPFDVRMDKDGNNAEAKSYGCSSEESLNRHVKTRCYFYTRNAWNYKRKLEDCEHFFCQCIAKDETTAIKIANEKRGIMLAMNIKESEQLEAK